MLTVDAVNAAMVSLIASNATTTKPPQSADLTKADVSGLAFSFLLYESPPIGRARSVGRILLDYHQAVVLRHQEFESEKKHPGNLGCFCQTRI